MSTEIRTRRRPCACTPGKVSAADRAAAATTRLTTGRMGTTPRRSLRHRHLPRAADAAPEKKSGRVGAALYAFTLEVEEARSNGTSARFPRRSFLRNDRTGFDEQPCQ